VRKSACASLFLLAAGAAYAPGGVIRPESGPIEARPGESIRVLWVVEGSHAAEALAIGAFPTVEVGSPDTARLRAEDDLTGAQPGLPWRVGAWVEIPSHLDSNAAGVWSAVPAAGEVWRLAVRSEGASAVRLRVDATLPDGASLLLCDAAGRIVASYDAGDLGESDRWLAVVPGAEARLVALVPSDAPCRIAVLGASHLYRPLASDRGDRDGEFSCLIDVMCEEVDPRARDSVGLLLFESNGGTYVCTGALIDDADPASRLPLLLTAGHCISTDVVAETTEVIWLFQSAACNASPPDPAFLPRSEGARLLTISRRTDSTLLLLDEPAIDGQGFSAVRFDHVSDLATPVRAIHHPAGMAKSYAEGTTTRDPPICQNGLEGLLLDSFLYGDFTAGQTFGGSSGSPLFDESWRVIGQLFGGCFFVGCPGGCDNDPTCSNWVYGRTERPILYGEIGVDPVSAAATGSGASTLMRVESSAEPHPVLAHHSIEFASPEDDIVLNEEWDQSAPPDRVFQASAGAWVSRSIEPGSHDMIVDGFVSGYVYALDSGADHLQADTIGSLTDTFDLPSGGSFELSVDEPGTGVFYLGPNHNGAASYHLALERADDRLLSIGAGDQLPANPIIGTLAPGVYRLRAHAFATASQSRPQNFAAGLARASFSLRIGPVRTCRADLAPPTGTLDLADLVAFASAFTASDPLADFDGNGLFDLADIVAFVSDFSTACNSR
jgi:hypothetical protein